MLNFVFLASFSSPVGPIASDQAAKMLTPGPITSGFKIWGVTRLGPLELNAATTGDGRTFNTVPPKLSTAVGLGTDFTYSLIKSPLFLPTATAGNKWLSATNSSPLAAVLASIIPIPPASRTTAPFSTRAFTPLSHNTTFPRTNAGSSEPGRHKLPELLDPLLYTIATACVAIPRAVPLAYPSKLAFTTCAPAAVLAVWVPCPSLSRGDTISLPCFTKLPPDAIWKPLAKLRAPMSFLLQRDELKSGPVSHSPRHRDGISGIPVSSKLLDSGHTPVSKTPTMTS
ncbi:hypothetical protein F8388_002129 [Cannabis sativa]|uniref:Uncharacterized protein n=1 Tax=Cannabis sativa TaxID=3483 RepID=A0A7J6H3P2_CANSA|nr:hypothetical protein F8388_002129 [Cannabis sativa]KAF4389847.1 hypothetical protein G4B88_024128 [Cannabis sativa]